MYLLLSLNFLFFFFFLFFYFFYLKKKLRSFCYFVKGLIFLVWFYFILFYLRSFCKRVNGFFFFFGGWVGLYLVLIRRAGKVWAGGGNKGWARFWVVDYLNFFLGQGGPGLPTGSIPA